MKKSEIRNWFLVIFKTFIFLLAIYYLFNVGKTHWHEISQLSLELNWIWIPILFLMSMTYTVMIMLLALNWTALLNYDMPAHTARIYFRSQALKYIPGNIFQFAYRHQQCNTLGIPHKILFKASVSESLGLVGVAVLISQPMLLPILGFNLTVEYLVSIQILMASLIVFIIMLFRRYDILLSIALYLGYLIGLVGLAWMVTQVLGLNVSVLLLFTACTASWAAGYIVPGAPGGMGVRESVFVLLLAQFINEGHALIIIALVRLVSLIVEALIYFLASPLSRFYQPLSAWSDKTKL